MSLAGHERVLIRLPSWLGDVVQAEPSVRALFTRLETPPSLAGPAPLLDLFDGRFPDAPRIPHPGRGGEQAVEWRGHDVALLLTNSFRSAWIALRARIPRRVGWSRDGRAPLLTDRMSAPLERGGTPLGVGRPGRGRRVLPRSFTGSCVELLGLLGVSVPETRPRLRVGDIARERIEERLRKEGVSDGEYLLINTGARADSAKAYPAERWAQVVELLAERVPLPVVLVCGPGEEAFLGAVRGGIGPGIRRPPLAVVDPVADLGELVALCAGARVVLTADSGPRHVALAAGARVVCVAGPTDPRHAADHLGGLRLVRREVDCGPCHRELCPLPGVAHHACMREVQPAELVEHTVALVE